MVNFSFICWTKTGLHIIRQSDRCGLYQSFGENQIKDFGEGAMVIVPRMSDHHHSSVSPRSGEHQGRFHVTALVRQDRLGPQSLHIQSTKPHLETIRCDLFATCLSRQLHSFSGEGPIQKWQQQMPPGLAPPPWCLIGFFRRPACRKPQ